MFYGNEACESNNYLGKIFQNTFYEIRVPNDNKRDATGSVYANIAASANAKTQYNWLKTKNAQNGCVSILTEAGNISNNFENPYSFLIKPIYKGQCVVVVVVLWLKITLY